MKNSLNYDLDLRIDTSFLNYINESHLLTSDIYEAFRSRFHSINLRYQYKEQKEFNTLKANADYPILSLDPLIKGEYNMGISRLYTNSGLDFISYTNRPECEDIFAQLRKLPKGKIVILYDHDIDVDKQKLEFVKKLLNNHKLVQIPAFEIIDKKFLYLDIRDFIYKAPLGGLVMMNLSNEIERQPMLYPFIDIKNKFGIQDFLEFSIKLWEINIHYHAEYTKNWSYENDCKTYLSTCKIALENHEHSLFKLNVT